MTGKTASGAGQTARLRGGVQGAVCGERVLTEQGFGRWARDRGGDSDSGDRRPRALSLRIRPGSATVPPTRSQLSPAPNWELRVPARTDPGNIWEFFNLSEYLGIL